MRWISQINILRSNKLFNASARSLLPCRLESSSTAEPQSGNRWVAKSGAAVLLATSALGFYAYKRRKDGQKLVDSRELSPLEHLAILKAGFQMRESQWMVTGTASNGGFLKSIFGALSLYQYCSCPFCCKVRAYLDYYGVDYDIIEVDPLSKSRISWSHYKKVPIVVMEDQELAINDSSIIMSVLERKRRDPKTDIETSVSEFPVTISRFKNGSSKYDYSNVYYLPGPLDEDEKRWREWVDNSLIPSIGLSVYNTLGNSIDAFRYFSLTGDWPNTLGSKRRADFVVYSGAIVMWIVSKMRRRRKNALKPSEVFNELCEKLKQTDHGLISAGARPDLADLSAYGALKSIEGCKAFKELVNENEDFHVWFDKMDELVKTHSGAQHIQADGDLGKEIDYGKTPASSTLFKVFLIISALKFLELAIASSSNI